MTWEIALAAYLILTGLGWAFICGCDTVSEETDDRDEEDRRSN